MLSQLHTLVKQIRHEISLLCLPNNATIKALEFFNFSGRFMISSSDSEAIRRQAQPAAEPATGMYDKKKHQAECQ